MGARLRADLGRIREVSARLGGIEREFSQSTRLSALPDVGSVELSGALDAFASGWSQHRQELIADLRQVATLSDAAATAYEGTDARLAAALTRAEGAG
jgi:hypothetical protein